MQMTQMGELRVFHFQIDDLFLIARPAYPPMPLIFQVAGLATLVALAAMILGRDWSNR